MAKKAAKGAAAKKKRTVSGKRGKPGKKTNQGVDPRGVAGIAVLCLGLLALFCQFIPSNGGFLNRCMLIVRGLGGMLCLLLPVVLCWTGVVLVFFGERKLSARTLILSSLIFLFVEAMFQLFRISSVNAALAADGAQASYGAFLARSFTMSSLDCKGGGLIGALLAWPLYKGLDVWGGMIVLIFATAIALMTLTGFSFGGIGMRISEWADDFRVEMRERREEKDALRDARQEEELERENALAIERQKRRQERLQKQKEEQEAAAREADEREKQRRRDEEIRQALETKPTEDAQAAPAEGQADADRDAAAGRRADGRPAGDHEQAAEKSRRAAKAQDDFRQRAALHRAGRRIYPRAAGRAYAHHAEPPQQLHHAGGGKRLPLRDERRPTNRRVCAPARRLRPTDGGKRAVWFERAERAGLSE